MQVQGNNRRVRLSIEVEPELHRRVKIAATERDMTIKDYVVRILESVATEEARRRSEGEEAEDLALLSAAAFARDWESEEDSVYDDLR